MSEHDRREVCRRLLDQHLRSLARPPKMGPTKQDVP
jgi:hypothetical protein